jgi:hypothetical protein
VAQLEHVAEQHDAIGVGGRSQQWLAQRGTTQQV